MQAPVGPTLDEPLEVPDPRGVEGPVPKLDELPPRVPQRVFIDDVPPDPVGVGEGLPGSQEARKGPRQDQVVGVHQEHPLGLDLLDGQIPSLPPAPAPRVRVEEGDDGETRQIVDVPLGALQRLLGVRLVPRPDRDDEG